MDRREKIDVQIRLDAIREQAEELHALLLDSNPATANKFHKISRYAAKLSTCLRVNDQLPIESPTPPIVNVAKGIHAISRRLK